MRRQWISARIDDDNNNIRRKKESQHKREDGSRVCVYVRTRPLPSDDPTGIPSLLFPDVTKVIVQEVKHDTIYKFDHVFPLDSTNNEVSEVICEPLVSAVISGNNGCFLVYGQTGSGKTHTVLYTGGVIPTTIEHIFNTLRNSNQNTYKVFLSYLQIYQERIYDLLLRNENTGPLTLREHPKEGIIIEGLLEEEVTSEENAKELIEIGQKKLIVTHTNVSPFSSRSHAVCILKVCKYYSGHPDIPIIQTEESCEEVPDPPVEYDYGKLHICDLAGTERATKLRTTSGRCLDESRHINTSLLELGNVIHALATKKNPYIPFRNSCLTRILQESLSGQSKARLMVCISASVSDLKETKCSLNFGQRAMKVMKETITNSEAHLDSRMLSESFTRKKLKKTDYKVLSKYLTSKLKELELAYKLEKDNLDALKRSQHKNEGSDEEHLTQDISTLTPSILERTLGIFDEDHSSQSQFMTNSCCQVDFDMHLMERRNEPESTEHVMVNETMAESLLIENVFNLEDTLPFKIAEPEIASVQNNDTRRDEIPLKILTPCCDSEEPGKSETPDLNYVPLPENYVSINHTEERIKHYSDTISIAIGTSVEDIHKLSLSGEMTPTLSEMGVQTDRIPAMKDSNVNVIYKNCNSVQSEATNYDGPTYVLDKDACQTNDVMLSCDSDMGDRKHVQIQVNNTSVNIVPDKHGYLTESVPSNSTFSVKIPSENIDKTEDNSCRDTVDEMSRKAPSSACYLEEHIQNNTINDSLTSESYELLDGNDCEDNVAATLTEVEPILCHDERVDAKVIGDSQKLHLQCDKHLCSDKIKEHLCNCRNLETMYPVVLLDNHESKMFESIQADLVCSEKTENVVDIITKCSCNINDPTISQKTLKNSFPDHTSDTSVLNMPETSLLTGPPCTTNSKDVIAGNNENKCGRASISNPCNEEPVDHSRKEIANDDISCNIHMENIDDDVTVQEDLKEQFVRENIELDHSNDDNVSGNDYNADDPVINVNNVEDDQMTQCTKSHYCISGYITEISKNDIYKKKIENNERPCIEASSQQCQEYVPNDKSSSLAVMDISDNSNVDVLASDFKKDFDIRDINDNDITEVHVKDIMIKFNNNSRKSSCNKKEMCVQTDEMQLGEILLPGCGSGNSSLSTQVSLPSECDEEREQFLKKFCYSASQHLPRDMDFEQKEAKCVTSDNEHDELYQGCLVYLTDTDSFSDYSELSEDGSFFSESVKSDADSDETLRAKLLMENIKNKYDVLLNDFELLSSERSRLQGESARKRNCYDLLTTFKSALEEELTKLGEESGRSSVCDTNDYETTKTCKSLGVQDSLKHVKRNLDNVELSPLEFTVPDGEQHKTPSKKLGTVTESFDENNNNVIDTNSIKEKLHTSSKTHLNSSRYSSSGHKTKSLSTTRTQDICKSLEGPPFVHRKMVPSLDNWSKSVDDTIEVDSMDKEKLKRELMLTKLEKSRLEAVLSCVLLSNDGGIDNDLSLRNLTMSRSTLASSTSMSQLPKPCRATSPSPFQSVTLPLRNYSYKDRRFGTPDSLPAISHRADDVTRSRVESKSRSIPETASVGDWLNGGNTLCTSGMRTQECSTISPSSSFAEITSMSDIDSHCVSSEQLNIDEDLLKDISLGKDVDMDKILEELQKSEKSPLACVPFIKRRSIRRKIKKAKKLCESQSLDPS